MAQGKHVRNDACAPSPSSASWPASSCSPLGGIAFSAYRYEQSRADRILPGVTIAGVDVGGMTRGEAVAAVRGGAAGASRRDRSP